MDKISLQMGFSGNPSAFALPHVNRAMKPTAVEAGSRTNPSAKETSPTAAAEYNRRFDRFELTGKAAEASPEKGNGTGKAAKSSSGKEVENGECQTCANRSYQDGSNDPGVSFKTPTKVAPGAAASAVRAHEAEHVSRNASKAESEGMNAHSTVSIHTAICPECGKTFVSGGTTRTTFTPKRNNDSFEMIGAGVSGVAQGSSGNPELLKKFGAGTSAYAA